MSNTRVDYRERQRLTAADLRREQAYRLGLMGQHAIAHHRPGVVRGLQVVETAGVFTLTPGIAIDGFGREIVVSDAIETDLSSAGVNRRYGLLHYCEDPQQLPPGRACADDPAPRILQRALVSVAAEFNPPDDAADGYTSARAAGIEGLAPWPVLVASHGAADAKVADYRLTTYTGARASMVRSPVDGSSMQIGSKSRTDFFHFLVSTRGSASAPTKRLGIDREGDIHVWGTLMISGRTGIATLEIGHNLALQFKAPIPAGEGNGVRVQGAFDPLLKTLSSVSMVVGTMPALGTSHVYHAPPDIGLKLSSVALAFGAGRMGSVELLDTRHGVTPFSVGRQRLSRGLKRVSTGGDPAPADDAAIAFSVLVKPLDAKLLLGASSAVATEPLPSRVLVFKPAADPKADPLTRELQAVVSSKPADSLPATELRIGGGADDDTDTSTRLSLGARDAAGGYIAGLRMDGGRRLTIPDRTGKADRALLVGKQTIYLPPIGPKDPLVPDLMLLAYLNGLWRAGNVTTSVKLELSSKVVDVGTVTRFEYDLVISPTSGFDIKRTFELISSQSGRGDLSFRSLEVARSTTNVAKQTVHQTIADFRRSERQVHVVVVMLVEIAGHARLVVSNALKFSY